MIVQEMKVVEAQHVSFFTETVNQLLSAGWKLSGGISVVSNTNTHQTTFYQAVVREFEQPGAWG